MDSLNATMKLIGMKIKFERIASGFKQAELANKLGLSRQHMSSIENGKNFKIETLIKILMVLQRTDLLTPLVEKAPFSPIELSKIESKQRKRVKTK